MTTLQDFIAKATRGGAFQDSGHPAQEVWALGCYVLGRPLSQLLAARAEESLGPQEEVRWSELIARRLSGEPLAYLLGTAEFWSLTLRVSPDVLVPRPETELLVEHALAVFAPGPLRYADVGTGSGAIALALKKERPAAFVVGFDKSDKALTVARSNALALGLDVSFVASDWLNAVQRAQFDVIVSNPPYIQSGDRCLAADGLRYEPRLALVGGEDGLSALRTVIAQAASRLNDGGRLLLEHGFSQGPATAALLRESGFTTIRTHTDLAGHERVTEGVFHGR